MFVNKSTKMMAALTALLFGIGMLVLLLITIGNAFEIYRIEGVDAFSLTFLRDIFSFAAGFVFSCLGFYFARDLKRSFHDYEVPTLGRDTWMFATGSFFFMAAYSGLNLIDAVTRAFAPKAFEYGGLSAQYALSSLLIYTFLTLVGATLTKLCLNIALELELFENATPHVIRKLTHPQWRGGARKDKNSRSRKRR